jgi:hypothetical protein
MRNIALLVCFLNLHKIHPKMKQQVEKVISSADNCTTVAGKYRDYIK